MKNIDIQIDEDYGLKTDPVKHDLVVGDVTLQNQALILIAQPGDGMDPSTFPRPYFRRDIIDDLGVR